MTDDRVIVAHRYQVRKAAKNHDRSIDDWHWYIDEDLEPGEEPSWREDENFYYEIRNLQELVCADDGEEDDAVAWQFDFEKIGGGMATAIEDTDVTDASRAKNVRPLVPRE